MPRTSSATRKTTTRSGFPEAPLVFAALWVAELLEVHAPRLLDGIQALNQRCGPPRLGLEVTTYTNYS
jgi:hypothetical protein